MRPMRFAPCFTWNAPGGAFRVAQDDDARTAAQNATDGSFHVERAVILAFAEFDIRGCYEDVAGAVQSVRRLALCA